MKTIYKIMFVFIIAFALFGCNTTGKLLPPNDETLVYKLPYDLTFLRTMEALNAQPFWQLEKTEKEKGIIIARDMNYSRLDDSDLRVITFMVKRVDKETTSVAIDSESQHVYGGDKLLKAIGEYLSREVKN